MSCVALEMEEILQQIKYYYDVRDEVRDEGNFFLRQYWIESGVIWLNRERN
jgi:hypothetical protein